MLNVFKTIVVGSIFGDLLLREERSYFKLKKEKFSEPNLLIQNE